VHERRRTSSLGASGLVASSTGYHDASTYERQIARCIDG
jgi:hypothetical protein